MHTIRKPTLRIGILNATRRGSELAIQVGDDLFIVRVRPPVVVSGARIVISDDLRIVCVRLAVVVVNSLLIGTVDSVNFAFKLLLRPTLGLAKPAIDLLLRPALGLAKLAVKFISVESCHYHSLPIEHFE
jgi:hypothetical protein